MSAAPLPGGGFLVTEYAGQRVLAVSAGGPGAATITTIAGTGSPGADHDATGPATSIPLSSPSDAQPTAEGGVLIANSGGNDVRYVAPDGTISTVAGGGACDDSATSCDGLSADQVALDEPVSVSPIQGGAGGFLIAEYGDDAVREVSAISPPGLFTTVAGTPGRSGYGGDGGPATSAVLSRPEQVVSAPDGSFWIADSGNEVIRQVSPGATIAGTPPPAVPTFAGEGDAATAASFDGPVAVSPLTGGNLLIADENNGRIREVTTPSVSTIALSPASPNGSNGWYTSSVTATVTASEGAAINCILDPPTAPPAFAAIPAGCSSTKSGTVSGDGLHTLYAASMNSFGDQEDPIDAVVKIDTAPPTTTCNGKPSFPAGTRRANVTATVTDSVSGPVKPIISARANTSHVGLHRALLAAENNAGILLVIECPYTVVPVRLKPLPLLRWAFVTVRADTSVRRLLVSDVAAHAKVNLTCHGTGCPFSTAPDVTGARCGSAPCRAKPKQLRRRTVDLTALFSGVRLGAGAQLTVSVTKANAVGGVWLFTTRSGRAPSHRITCLEPGSSTPGQGCASGR